MRFQRRGGRKRVVVPDGSETVPRHGAAKFEAWFDRLTGLDRAGRTVELTNFSEAALVRVEHQPAATSRCAH